MVPDHGDIPGRRHVAVCLLLAFAGGFADAGTFVLAGTFSGHLTGNALLAMIYLGRGDLPHAALCLLALAAFLGGTILGTRLPHPARANRARAMLPVTVGELLLAAASIAVARIGGPFAHSALLFGIALPLGLQNGFLKRLEDVPVHSTYITGMTTALVAALERPGPDAARDPKRRVLAGILTGFLVGALCGALLSEHAGLLGFAVLLIPFMIATAICLSAPAGPTVAPAHETSGRPVADVTFEG